MRVLDDGNLMKAIDESAAHPALCMANVLRTEGLTAALSTDTGKTCGFDSAVEKAAVTIKNRFPDLSDDLAKNTAAKYLGWMMFFASLGDGPDALK